MAFTYTTAGYDKVGKVNRVWGTWSAAAVTSGTISFGPINGLSINQLVDARVCNSVSAVTETAKKLVIGTATTQNTIAITCVSGDSGYWAAEWI